jgi:hypothetical protein
MRGGPAKPASKSTSRRRRAPIAEVATTAAASSDPPSEQRPKERREEAAPPSEPVSAVRTIDAAAAATYQRVYAAARITGRDGHIQLDEQRFAQSLADLVVDPLTEQVLYSLALMAAADGDASLFKDDVITEPRSMSC